MSHQKLCRLILAFFCCLAAHAHNKEKPEPVVKSWQPEKLPWKALVLLARSEDLRGLSLSLETGLLPNNEPTPRGEKGRYLFQLTSAAASPQRLRWSWTLLLLVKKAGAVETIFVESALHYLCHAGYRVRKKIKPLNSRIRQAASCFDSFAALDAGRLLICQGDIEKYRVPARMVLFVSSEVKPQRHRCSARKHTNILSPLLTKPFILSNKYC